MAFIEFKNLHTWFYTDAGIVKAVNGVDFEIRKGETVCVVGESGCGKSVTSLSLMHLVQSPPGKIVDGEILMDGRDLLKLSKSEMEHVNGKDVAMIFQEPMTSLNPVLKVGHQIMESILFHTDATKEEARAKALASSDDVLACSKAYQETVLEDMEVLRKSADEAEALIPDELLPYPTYDELLFSI